MSKNICNCCGGNMVYIKEGIYFCEELVKRIKELKE